MLVVTFGASGVVFPTCVGMVRAWTHSTRWTVRFPHMRGDGPHQQQGLLPFTQFSPHAWGWSVPSFGRGSRPSVFPTCVGMVRNGELLHQHRASFPHMRGDGPYLVLPPTGRAWFSPHAWGWSETFETYAEEALVFPTCVGMVRPRTATACSSTRFPHMRGDGPPSCAPCRILPTFSPHAWGWSENRRIAENLQKVFPTCVGMVRVRAAHPARLSRFPHMRGDGPKNGNLQDK